MRVALSWDGGPLDALALLRLREAGHDVALVHVTDAATRRDRASGVPGFLVHEQAACLGLPLSLRASSAADREAGFAAELRSLAPDAVAFGSVRSLAWEERVASAAGLRVLRPLEGFSLRAALGEALARGFRAFVVACRAPLGPPLLGRFLEPDMLDALGRAGEGAWSAFVVEGPLFLRRVDATAGDVLEREEDGWRLDLGLRGC